MWKTCKIIFRSREDVLRRPLLSDQRLIEHSSKLNSLQNIHARRTLCECTFMVAAGVHSIRIMDIHPFPSSVDKPKSDMTEEELRQHEQDEFVKGPMRLLAHATTASSPLLFHLRNDHKLIANRVRAFDRHCNVVLEGVREFWREGKGGRGRGKKRRLGAERERHVSKMFLRGDSIILIVDPTANKL